MKNPKSIRSLFSLPGFGAASTLGGVFGEQYARVIVLRRRKKRRSARSVVAGAVAATTGASAALVISRPAASVSTFNSNVGGSTVRGAAACM